MPEFAYDLHIHSCLSPCGDESMTPANIVNMAHLKGLDIIAITDHNTALNAAAAIRAARDLPLTVLAGIEVTTAEEIHLLCLFPNAESAERAGEIIYGQLQPVQNKPEYFGEQIIMDENENVLGSIDLLLSNATNITYEQLPKIVGDFGGICWPAHIDRPSNSVLSVFGVLPETPSFPVLEVHQPQSFFSEPENAVFRQNHKILCNSDAHILGMISEREHFISLSEPSFEALKAALFSDKSE